MATSRTSQDVRKALMLAGLHLSTGIALTRREMAQSAGLKATGYARRLIDDMLAAGEIVHGPTIAVGRFETATYTIPFERLGETMLRASALSGMTSDQLEVIIEANLARHNDHPYHWAFNTPTPGIDGELPF